MTVTYYVTGVNRIASLGQQWVIRQAQAAKELLRHKDIKTTLRYSHLDPKYLRDAVEKIVDKQVVPRLSADEDIVHNPQLSNDIFLTVPPVQWGLEIQTQMNI